MKFKTLGNKENPAVLFFHAMGVTGDSSEPVAKCLQSRYFCIMPTSTVYCEGQKYKSKADEVRQVEEFLLGQGVEKIALVVASSIGADLAVMHLKQENGYLVDLDELRSLVTPDTKMICINNPNNPTGALMGKELLEEIVKIARSVDAYLLCDEVYRHLTQTDIWSESVADLYEKGISVSSMSKVFSLAGLRLGWIATHDEAALAAFRSHRDYDLISCGMFDEAVAAIALGHKDTLIARNTGIVRMNLAILDDWVNSSEHFFYTKPQAGTTALVYYDFDIPSYDFCTRMYHETGAFVTPGDCFEQPHSMRIGYASDTETLKAGLAAISEFAAKLS